MKKFVLDTHTHTVASGHAYGTVLEMARAASEQGLELLAVTDHAPKLPGTCGEMHFRNFKVIDKYLYGVEILMGVELNLIDYKGTVDMEKGLLKRMALCIASLHTVCLTPGTKKENTETLLKVMDNPYIHIIGHPDDNRYPVDFEAVVKAAHDNNTLIELNNASLKPGGPRTGTWDNDRKMLEMCKRYGTHITISSDAHVEEDIGNFEYALQLIEEMDFPERLIAGTDYDKLSSFLNIGKK